LRHIVFIPRVYQRNQRIAAGKAGRTNSAYISSFVLFCQAFSPKMRYNPPAADSLPLLLK
jgi:hypothetical protein